MPVKILKLEQLSERHPGVTPAVGDYFFEAACVCLSRHHQSPTEFDITYNGDGCVGLVAWTPTDGRTQAAWANEPDATRDAAYCVALAAVEDQQNLVAIGRAESRSGADYLLMPVGVEVEDFETAIRLEVSGIDSGSNAAVTKRLSEKLEQASRGESDLPAIAAVVGFKVRAVAIKDLDQE